MKVDRTVNRFLVALLIGVGSGLLSWLVYRRFHLGAADFGWALQAAQDLLAGRDPYNRPFQEYAIPYPLPAAFFGLPFVWFSPETGAALFFGCSSGLLAFAVTKDDYTRLLIFFAYPYWAALLTAQWSPLITAAAFLPFLAPLLLVKPQIALPVVLTSINVRGAIACVIVGIVSLIVQFDWPLRWFAQIGSYQRFIPLLLIPGPAILLALLNYRDTDARFLLIASIMPQRWFYDCLTLWLIPKTRRELVLTALVSWGALVWRIFVQPKRIEQVGTVAVLCCYLPMLAVILRRWYIARYQTSNATPSTQGIPNHN